MSSNLTLRAGPLVLEGVVLPETPGQVHWDGGMIDCHSDIDFGAGEGLVLYPHFDGYVVHAWFDKVLSWRRARPRNFRRTLLIAASDALVATLPGRRLPDRRDFAALPNAERITDVVQPWAPA